MSMNRCRLIAETAFSHEGSAGYLKSLVAQLISTDIDIIKFQILSSLEYGPDHPFIGSARELVIPQVDWNKLFLQTKSAGKSVMVLPVDKASLVWALDNQNVDIIEVHSVNLFRRDFFDLITKSTCKKQFILSISGYELSDAEFIIREYQNALGQGVSLMFGFQSFPTNPCLINFNKMQMLKTTFSLDIGYADHTAFNQNCSMMIFLAITHGASFIEKHVVLDPGDQRIDFETAISPKQINAICSEISVMEQLKVNEGILPLSKEEKAYGNRRLKLVATKPIKKGDPLVLGENIGYLWPAKPALLSPIQTFSKPDGAASSHYEVGQEIC